MQPYVFKSSNCKPISSPGMGRLHSGPRGQSVIKVWIAKGAIYGIRYACLGFPSVA